MKKLLVLFVLEFPYGISEPFLEQEHPLYKNYFDKVLIVTNKPKSKDIRGKKTRSVDETIIEILPSEFNKNIWMILKMGFYIFTDPNTYKDLWKILTKHKYKFQAIKDLLSPIGKANLCVELAHKRVKELEKEGYSVKAAYSYWLNYPAYAAVKFSKKYYGGELYTVSRAHRFDLYEYSTKSNYIMAREYVLTGLSEIAIISNDGKKYLEETYPDYKMNITIARLGAKDVAVAKKIEKKRKLRLVSCSRVTDVKRLDKIVDALSKIKDIQIEWTHFGDGELLESVKEKAKKLSDNIECIFTGAIPNAQIYEKYREIDFHAILNVSDSEGIPVSIMEAMSFGIPIIATNVGGVSELVVDNENGFLLDKDYKDEELIELIYRFYNMSETEFSVISDNAREMFDTRYNAEKNYKKFLAKLSKLYD